MSKKKSTKPPVMWQDRQYACVYDAGKKIFLGKWGSEEADRKYKRFLAGWVSELGEADVSPEGNITLDQLSLRFLKCQWFGVKSQSDLSCICSRSLAVEA